MGDETLVIRVAQSEGGSFTASVDVSANLRGQHQFVLPEELRQGFNIVAARAREVAQEVPQEGDLEQTALQLGRKLFDALFDGAVSDAFASVRSTTLSRVILRFDGNQPELVSVPWELMDGEGQGSQLARRYALTRRLEIPTRETTLVEELPLRMLIVCANPPDTPPLALEEEVARIATKLAQPIKDGTVELQVVGGDLEEAHDLVEAWRPHVFHFAGHGEVDEHGDAVLLFGQDQVERVDKSQLTAILNQARPVLVYLNACRGAQVRVNTFGGMAQALMHEDGIPAVVAMQFAVDDSAAIRVAASFYGRLVSGSSAEDALRFARATLKSPVEWATPVLYVGPDDSKLLNVQVRRADSRPARTFPPPTGVGMNVAATRRPVDAAVAEGGTTGSSDRGRSQDNASPVTTLGNPPSAPDRASAQAQPVAAVDRWNEPGGRH